MSGGRRRAAPAVAVVVVVLAAGLLAGCSRAVDGAGARLVPPRASELLAGTATTMAGLASGFGVSVSADVGGEKFQEDLRLQGDDGAGTLTRQGGQVELRRTGGRAFARAAASFWQLYGLDATAVASVDGVWTELHDEFALGDLVRPSAYYETLADQDSTYSSVRSGVLDGTRVWVLTATSGGTISVTADGAPRLRQMAAGDNTVDFTYPTDDLRVETPADPVPFPG